jgi:PAS domain S-box-containing protein
MNPSDARPTPSAGKPSDLPAHLEEMLGEARMAVWRWDPGQDVGTASSLIDELWGLPPGQTLRDSKLGFSLIHPEDRERQEKLVGDAVARGGSWHNEFRIIRPRDGKVAWLEERAHATRDPITGKVTMDGVTWDITARKEAEEALRSSEEKYRTLFNSIDEGFAIWKVLYDAAGNPVDARILEGNAHFLALPGHADAIGKTSREVFPDADNWWIETFHEVIQGGVPVRFERYFLPVDRWLEVHLCPLGPSFPDQVSVVFSDVTERRDSSETLRASEEKYRTLFNSIDEGFCLVQMIFDAAGKPVDFLYLEVNPGFLRHTGFDPVGRRVREVLPDYEQVLLDHYAAAVDSDEVLRLEHPVQGMEGQWFRSTAFRHGDPASRQVAIVFTNITEERRAAEAIRRSEARSQYFIHLEDAIRPLDEAGAIQHTASRLLAEQLGLDRVYYAEIREDRKTAEVRPDYFRPGLKSVAGTYATSDFLRPFKILEAGEILRLNDCREETPETAAALAGLDALAVLGVPLVKEGGLAWVLGAISTVPRVWTDQEVELARETADRTWAAVQRARAEEALRASEQRLIHFNAGLEAEVRARTAELKESRDLLHSVLDTSLIGMALLEAVRDASGEVVDFRIRLVNARLKQMTGDAYMPGKLLARDFPAVRNGMLDRMIRVLRTREPEGLEYPNSAKPGTWYHTLFVPNGDSLVATTLDISERRRDEEALTEAHASMELKNRIHAHAEEIAGMGTWTWNTATDVFTYSDNLYRLFGMKPGEVEPALGQIAHFIHPEDQARVQASSRELRATGERAMALEYRVIRKDGSLRYFSNRVQKVAELENGYMLVGITEDITERKLEETHNRQLLRQRSEAEERQRRALLAATLNTQEEERRRISESLHNGIGQMLYGIQLNLNLLDLKPGDAWEGRHARQLRATSRLLSDAISESRRISHAIMPHVLEDFGLKAAVDDICRQFHGKLKVDCQFATLPEKIEQYIQIALYRTIQELMTNIVKHAGAEAATVRLHHEDGSYHLEVHDNGRGFDATVQATGIGLKTLREKIGLLKGDFDVQSGSDGTRIKVRIPTETLKET